jgi:hypothetical protein
MPSANVHPTHRLLRDAPSPHHQVGENRPHRRSRQLRTMEVDFDIDEELLTNSKQAALLPLLRHRPTGQA